MAVFLIYVISPVIVSIIFSFFNKRNGLERNNRIILLIINGVLIALMIGLRKYTNGSGDSEVYYNHWKESSNVSFLEIWSYLSSSTFEYGYSFCVFILSHIFTNPQFAFVISGAFISLTVCFFVGRNCKNIHLALLVFNSLELFIFMVQGLRQAIAMGICLFALEQCKKRNPLKFSFLVLISMLFHASAVVFFFVYLLPYLKLNINYFTIFVIICILAVVFIPYLFDFVNLFVREEYSISNDIEDGSGIVPIIIYILVLLFAFIVKPEKVSLMERKDYSLFFYMTAIALLALSMRNTVASITERISYFFAFGEMVLISNSIESIPVKKIKFFCELVVIGLCFGVAIHKCGYSSLIPYNFFWQ